MLHTNSMTAGRRISMFGTVNLDMRSLWLNYEVALFVYGVEFGEELHALQQSYVDDCECVVPETWSKRPRSQRFLEDVLRLISPVL
jgi:cardiolipin synthase